jgi:hypothetical protein
LVFCWAGIASGKFDQPKKASRAKKSEEALKPISRTLLIVVMVLAIAAAALGSLAMFFLYR